MKRIKHDLLPRSSALQPLFTTSLLGIGPDRVGMGLRSKEERQRFRKDLIDFYDAGYRKPNNPKELRTALLFDNATGIHFNKYLIRAAPILPYKLGPDLMTVFFEEGSPEESTSAPNGLLLHCAVADAMEDGAIAIVPDLPFNPSPAEVATFNATNPKDYKWRVIDTDAESLDAMILPTVEQGASRAMEVLRVRDLDGRDVHFKNDARPRTRYCYFLFCSAILKWAWRFRCSAIKDRISMPPVAVVESQLSKGVWAMLGSYMSESFLSALAAYLGMETPAFDANVRVDKAGILGLAKLIQAEKAERDREDEGEEDEWD